jgi:hypothetical protein
MPNPRQEKINLLLELIDQKQQYVTTVLNLLPEEKYTPFFARARELNISLKGNIAELYDLMSSP